MNRLQRRTKAIKGRTSKLQRAVEELDDSSLVSQLRLIKALVKETEAFIDRQDDPNIDQLN